MTDEFSDLLRDDELDESPGWADEAAEEDELDQLRQGSARAGSLYDDMADADDDQATGLSFRELTASQRLILVILLLLNIIIIGFGILVVTGSYSL